MPDFKTHEEILHNTGFKKPHIVHFGKKKHWKRPLVSGIAIRPDGQWVNDVEQLELETQNQYVETMDCWSWNTNVIVEIMIWVQFAIKFVSSKRFSSVMGKGTPNGGDIQAGCETVRNDGLLPENELPWTSDQNTWYKFHSPDPMTPSLRLSASKWLRKFSYTHDWVVSPNLFGRVKVANGGDMYETIWFDLTFSPLGVAVYAWPQADADGLEHNSGYQYNHWTKIVGGVYQQYWIVYDSYTQCWRKLIWRYPFRWVKRYQLGLSPMAQVDADYIIKKFEDRNIKGDVKNTIFRIQAGRKCGYASMDEFNQICSMMKWDPKDIIVVSQVALDLVSEWEMMTPDGIKYALDHPYSSPNNP